MLTPASQLVAKDLATLGLESGDTVLVMADVRYLRLPKGTDGTRPRDYAKELLLGLREAVGHDGTLVFLTFTATSWKVATVGNASWFDRSTQPSTGSLASLAVRQSDALRSRHPVNSFTAIGAGAAELVRFHTPSAFAFRPIERLIDVKGKMLIVGCIATNPGFSTVHLAQHHLGLSTRTLLAGRGMVWYRDDGSGKRAKFIRRDIPGCSAGFGKMYEIYRAAGILKEGTVAKAPSMLIEAEAAYALDYATLKDDPESLLCDDPDCRFCRGLITYGKSSPARYWVRRTGQEVRLRAGSLEKTIKSGGKTTRLNRATTQD